MSYPAIEVEGVWKKFCRGELHDSLRDLVPAIGRWVAGRRHQADDLRAQEFWALKDLNFSVERGEALGIIGPNGAGKSTLLKILSRVLRPNRGHYLVHGRLRALIEVASGFHTDLTGRENIYLNGAILGMRKTEIDHRLDEIIDFSGIEAFIDTPVKRYSSGMQARLGFSVAAHMDPEVLLVDEVLSVGDAAFRAKCLRHMERLVRSDVSVVFISHNLEQVRHLCQKALVLDHGEMRYYGDVESACRVYYQCFENSFRGQGNDGVKANGTGRILRVRVLDGDGSPSFRVAAYEQLTVEIQYHLEQDVSGVGLIARIVKPAGMILTGCSTVHDAVPIPSTTGFHTVALQIEGLPFASGDYQLTVQMVDHNGTNLDADLAPYPLAVKGPTNLHWDVYLACKWKVSQNNKCNVI